MTIACTRCDENGCEDCGQLGYVELPGCPKKYAGKEMADLVMYAELMQKGLPPVTGGVLDQSASFIEAATFYWSEIDRGRAEQFKD